MREGHIHHVTRRRHHFYNSPHLYRFALHEVDGFRLFYSYAENDEDELDEAVMRRAAASGVTPLEALADLANSQPEDAPEEHAARLSVRVVECLVRGARACALRLR
jgi:hypothetical protein